MEATFWSQKQEDDQASIFKFLSSSVSLLNGFRALNFRARRSGPKNGRTKYPHVRRHLKASIFNQQQFKLFKRGTLELEI